MGLGVVLSSDLKITSTDNRHQFTVINSCKSTRRAISYGVPQCSILGPLLFLMYINDLHTSSSFLSFLLFADDTTITCSKSSCDSLVHTLNSELIKVSSWFKSNKLSLNPNKTKCMLFNKSNNPPSSMTSITVDDIPICMVHSTKFVGVVIDDKLRSFLVTRKFRTFLPPSTLFSLNNTLILPYLNYCNIVWARSSNNQLHSLMIIQKRVIRICTFSHPRDHTAPLFARLNTLTLPDINKLHTGIFMYTYINNLLPRGFSSFFTAIHDIHSYCTRAHRNLFLPFTRTSYSINTLRFHGPRLWNSIDESVKNQPSVGSFKNSFKQHLVSSYLG